MRLIKVLLALAAFIAAQPVMAQGGPPNGKGPIGRLQAAVEQLTVQVAEVDALRSRVEALEADAHSAPDPGVGGRTYCRTRSLTVLVGIPAFEREVLVRLITRQVATFESGTGMAVFETISNVSAVQNDFGTITLEDIPPGGPIDATYTQTDTQVDVTFPGPDTLTHHVSKDGSFMHGWRVAPADMNPANVTIIESTLVEIDPMSGAQCGEDEVPPG